MEEIPSSGPKYEKRGEMIMWQNILIRIVSNIPSRIGKGSRGYVIALEFIVNLLDGNAFENEWNQNERDVEYSLALLVEQPVVKVNEHWQ